MSFHDEQFDKMCKERQALEKLRDEWEALEIKIMDSDAIWVTKSGKNIPINKMSNQHLENTINFLIKKMQYELNDKTFKAYIAVMRKELEKRNEHL